MGGGSRASAGERPVVGVLALQGAFREHIACVTKAGGDAVEVRKAEQLDGLAGLIIPGGESTTMALVAERWNLFPALRAFASSGRPIWGTCAGLIFLAEQAQGAKQGGQELIGGLNVTVHRNFFGAQVASFETQLPAPAAFSQFEGAPTYRALFIRAPAVLSAGPGVEVLSEYAVPKGQQKTALDIDKVVVAVRQGSLLATAFHPELTDDLRWHQLFLSMCDARAPTAPAADTGATLFLTVQPDLPVFTDNVVAKRA